MTYKNLHLSFDYDYYEDEFEEDTPEDGLFGEDLEEEWGENEDYEYEEEPEDEFSDE